MAQNSARPLSPHLGIWKWGAAMAVSILHRATGTALATAGMLGLVWWLLAVAAGKPSYVIFQDWAGWWPGKVVMIGLTWAFFQHLCSGIRHFVMDVGAGFELKTNRTSAFIVFSAAVTLTTLLWTYLLVMKG